MTSRRSHRHPALAAALLGALACGRSGDPTADLSGQQLAERYCASCHLLPEPALLDQASWRRWVLPRMARRLGLHGVGDAQADERLEGGIAGELVRAAGVFPDSARITRAAWQRLADYYLRAAPAALGAPATPPVAIGVPGFQVRVPTFRIASPMVTLVHVDSVRHRIFVGDATPTGPALTVLDAAGRVTASYPLPSPVSHLQLDGDTMKLVFMGKLHPSDVPRGALAVITAWRPGSSPSIAWEVDTLQRPVHASYADLNGDGVQDAVVSEFGNLTGRLAWYERTPAGVNVRHVLAPQPGAITTVVRDFDGDGHLDVLALMAQGDEGIVLFRGGPRGAFARETVLRFPPAYGVTSMQVADANGDGRPDIVLTNGDAGDYPAPTKPYHGVRIFLNDGAGKFAERYFFPMPGAFKAIARDFDGDGDVDVAAIAFYPDYASGHPLSFVYLENTGGLHFTAHTFPDADRGRWLTMDAGDVDGDGDVDLVLGSFAQLDALGDERGVSARWRRPDAPTLVILENTRVARP